jgi:hypothetical protein
MTVETAEVIQKESEVLLGDYFGKIEESRKTGGFN